MSSSIVGASLSTCAPVIGLDFQLIAVADNWVQMVRTPDYKQVEESLLHINIHGVNRADASAYDPFDVVYLAMDTGLSMYNG